MKQKNDYTDVALPSPNDVADVITEEIINAISDNPVIDHERIKEAVLNGFAKLGFVTLD